MSQESQRAGDTAAHGPAMADDLALELASGRVDYLAKLIIAALTRDPYLRSPISEDWSWTEMRPYVQDLVNRNLQVDGDAARRWAEVSASISALDVTSGMTRAELAHRLSEEGTHLLNVLHLINAELG